EGSYILGNRDLNPVVDPHPGPVLENPQHVVLLLQCLGIDLGPEVSRTCYQRIGLIVQVRRVIDGRFQVFRDWVAADEKYLAVFHCSQVFVLRHLSGRRMVRNRLRATREQRKQHQQSQQWINVSNLSNEFHLTLLGFQLQLLPELRQGRTQGSVRHVNESCVRLVHFEDQEDRAANRQRRNE